MKKLANVSREEMISLLTPRTVVQAEALEKLGVTIDTLKRRLKELNIDHLDYSDYRAKYNVFVFDSIDTEDKAYWLGFLYADGNVRSDDSIHNNNTVSVELSFVDYGHLIKFKTFMEDQRPDSIIRICERPAASGRMLKFATYDTCNAHLRQSLINAGCLPNKSNILEFPDESIFATKDLIYDFIRGYIDGDGCLSKTVGHGNRLALSIRGTKNFLEGIRNYFPQFTKVYSEVDNRTKTIQYRLLCCSNKADQVAYKLYENSNIYLDRKFDKYATLCKLHHSEKLGNNGEGCDANTVITDSIAEGESVS